MVLVEAGWDCWVGEQAALLGPCEPWKSRSEKNMWVESEVNSPRNPPNLPTHRIIKDRGGGRRHRHRFLFFLP